MGLPAHRYAATTQLPIVPASDGGWEWGSPDDRRSLNQGTDRWQRLGPIPAVKRQEWARVVLLCWGKRATERAKDQPIDFVREVVEDKMRDQSKERREQVIRNLRSWVETPESRAKLRLDAACEYRRKLADRHKLPDDWAGWFPAILRRAATCPLNSPSFVVTFPLRLCWRQTLSRGVRWKRKLQWS